MHGATEETSYEIQNHWNTIEDTFNMTQFLIRTWVAFVLFFGWGAAAVKYDFFPWPQMSATFEEIELAIKGDDEGSKLDLITGVGADFVKKPLKHLKSKSEPAEKSLATYAEMGRFPDALEGKCLKVATSHNGHLGVLLIGDGARVLHHWDADYDRLFDTENIDKQIDINGSLVLPDGSIVVNYSFHKGIARITANNKLFWKNEHGGTHHSVTKTSSNTLWVPGRELLQEQRLGQPAGRLEDLLYELDIETGKTKRKIYTVDIFRKNSIHGLYEWIISEDKVHVNDIEEVGRDFSAANIGLSLKPTDIIMTGKRMNVVLIVDPDTLEAKYVAHHPWNQPHDTDPMRDGSFLLFDNNQAKGKPNRRWGTSRILSINPSTNDVEVIFSADWFYSGTKSSQQLSGDQLLITSDNSGYVFNIVDGKPNYWLIKEDSKKKNWFLSDAEWIDASYFENSRMQSICAGEAGPGS